MHSDLNFSFGFKGGLEFSEWSSAKDSCRTESTSLTEPPVNFITDRHGKGYRRLSLFKSCV